MPPRFRHARRFPSPYVTCCPSPPSPRIWSGSSPETVVFPVIRRPPVARISCGPGGGSGRSHHHLGELVEVQQLRPQFGLHQSPRVSLFTCCRSQLFWRSLGDTPGECNAVAASHRARAYSRSPSVMCSFAGNAASLHQAPDCNRVSWKVGTTRGLVSSASILRFSESSPPVPRPCRASSNCSRSSLGCR